MDRIERIALNVIFCVQVLLLFLLAFESRVQLPLWLQVAGRMHPLVLHLPIGMMALVVILVLLQKKLDQSAVRPIVQLALVVTALSASFAALFGFFLSLHGDYGSDALTRHKVSGVLLSCLCYIVVLLYKNQKGKASFLAAGSVTIILLFMAGHTGSVLTHGDNFLLAPVSGEDEVVLTVENASVYQFAVEPILKKKCFGCHNDSKAKGGLVMTSVDKFKAGGKHGKVWVEGNPAESHIIQSIYLPLSSDEHMPPDGKPQLTALEIATLKAWIRSGADFEKKLAEFKEPDSLQYIVASFASAKEEKPVEVQYAFNAVSDDVVQQLNTPFRSVFPLYEGSPALQADFFVKKAFEIKALDELKKVKDQLVVLNLSKMPVTDKEIATIASFINLEQLNLNFTALEGKTLPELKTLVNLKSLSLSGTAITAQHLPDVLNLPSLKALYVWNTKCSEEDISKLAKEFPRITIISQPFTDNSILTLSKPVLVNEGVVKATDPLMLKHTMPGVAIRYTTDGTDPDTVSGKLYDTPFNIDHTLRIKARACKDGWHCSDVYEVVCFVQSTKPANTELLTPTDKQYVGEGVKSLTDNRKGFADVIKEQSWLGYSKDPFVAAFTFDEQSPKSMVISYAWNTGPSVFPPEAVEVWAGSDGSSLKLVKSITPEQPKGYDANRVEALTIHLPAQPYKYYKVVAKPVRKMPAWHGAKGKPGWFFVDEVFFYY